MAASRGKRAIRLRAAAEAAHGSLKKKNDADESRLTICGNRARVLNILQRQSRPMTPYEILDEMCRTGRYFPTTVYRALAQLMALGAVHRLASRSAYIACTRRGRRTDEVHVLAICKSCGSVEEHALASVLPRMLEASDQWEFEVAAVTFELQGLCRKCARRSERA